MDQKIFSAPQRAFASIVRSTRTNIQPFFSNFGRARLQHPALAHPSEEVCVQHSLDLSFQQAVVVSCVDRHIIDNLNRTQWNHLQMS